MSKITAKDIIHIIMHSDLEITAITLKKEHIELIADEIIKKIKEKEMSSKNYVKHQ